LLQAKVAGARAASHSGSSHRAHESPAGRNMKRIPVVALTVASVLMASSGCASWGDNQKKGTVIGAGGGAVLGGVIGHQTGSPSSARWWVVRPAR
jgi:hypothetical protein